MTGALECPHVWLPARGNRRGEHQLRERGADVTVLEHGGGHTIEPATLPPIAELLRDGAVR